MYWDKSYWTMLWNCCKFGLAWSRDSIFWLSRGSHHLALPLGSYCRRRYPPRSLLDLVDEEVMVRTLVIQRANSISMFQAVRSWTLSSSSPTSPLLGPFHAHHQHVIYTRAKLASGVPLLIDSVGSDWMIHRHRIRQSRSHTSRRKTLSRLQKLKRLVVG